MGKYRKRSLGGPTPRSEHLHFMLYPLKPKSYFGDGKFQLTNLDHIFGSDIDWNFSDYGKLWTYHLNYFDFLQQDISPTEGQSILFAFMQSYPMIINGRDPYPTSLRIINSIKFVSKYEIRDAKIDNLIWADSRWLCRRLEYHLMGNHLLENLFALLFAAYYFRNIRLFDKVQHLLMSELEEQILPDGGHFELSPMYHLQIIFRLLESIDLIRQNDLFSNLVLADRLEKFAGKMLGWISQIHFSDGQMPRLSDSIQHAFPALADVAKAAKVLKLSNLSLPLEECGYRKFNTQTYELLVDVGPLGPKHIPGHGHADALHFVLFAKSKPLIVDTGCSTYEPSPRRDYERSTMAHNTVSIGGINQSEMWATFRVARRAEITIVQDLDHKLIAHHDGYLPVRHERRFFIMDNELMVKDVLTESADAEARFHFYPGLHPTLEANKVQIGDTTISIHGATELILSTYEYSRGFHKTESAIVLVCRFCKQLQTYIRIQ